MSKRIVLEHVSKIFGDKPERALALLKSGAGKDQLLAETGCSVGVDDVSMTIDAGETFVVMGLSGSGKSTLVRMLNRLIEPTAGRILIEGEDIGQLSDKGLRELRRRDFGMVFQSFALLPHLTVLDNAAFGLELAGHSKAQRLQAAHDALAQVGLAQWANSYPDELSGGMQQRVGLARALAADPAILLMDEAFSALDPIIRTDMQTELIRLQAIKRRTIVFISHDLDEAMRIGDRIAIMRDGHLQQVGTPEEILRAPANDYVRNFVQGVDPARVFKAGDIVRNVPIVVAEQPGKGSRAALAMLEAQDRDFAYVLSPERRFMGVVSAQSLRNALDGHVGPLGLAHAFIDGAEPVAEDELVNALFGKAAHAPCPLPVVAGDGRFKGAISRTNLLRFMDPSTPVP